jgi:protein required for attachment to host cells
MRIWIVVADEREALFYDAKGPHGPFELAQKLQNPRSAPDRELESDRPGRAMASPGGGTAAGRAPRHALDGDRSAQRAEQARFARTIAHEIDHARTQRRFDRFVIMSAPRMLGLIRSGLTSPSRAVLAGEVAKDLAHQGERALDRRLPEALANAMSPPR